MLQNMDRLKVFYHVFTENSVIGASKTLHVSQSAVSQSIQKLESEINSQLFTRLHKRLVPTSAGKHLFETIKPFMVQLDICLNSLEQAKGTPYGELRIGAPREFGKTNFPGIVAAFRQKHPDVTFFLKFGDAGTLLPMVENGKLDFALVDVFLTQNYFAGNLDIFHFEPVVEEEIILACSRKYDSRSLGSDHSFQSLIQQQFIAYREDAQTIRNWFKHHFRKFNVDIDVILTVDSHQAVISAIRNHVGLGVVASDMVRNLLYKQQIVAIRTSKPEIINPISLVHLQEKVPSLTEKHFEQFLLDTIRGGEIS